MTQQYDWKLPFVRNSMSDSLRAALLMNISRPVGLDGSLTALALKNSMSNFAFHAKKDSKVTFVPSSLRWNKLQLCVKNTVCLKTGFVQISDNSKSPIFLNNYCKLTLNPNSGMQKSKLVQILKIQIDIWKKNYKFLLRNINIW